MDPIADLLTRIRNASHALKPTTSMPHSKAKESVVRIIKKEGYIRGFNVEGGTKKTIKVELKYQGRKGVISGIKRESRLGLRRYVKASDLPLVLGGMGIAVVSTSRGLMTGTEARRQQLGGELLCTIW